MFHHIFVDVSAVDSIIAIKITELYMLFINETTDLNASYFNEETRFHILLDFGPYGGYLKRLSLEIKSGRFNNVK